MPQRSLRSRGRRRRATPSVIRRLLRPRQPRFFARCRATPRRHSRALGQRRAARRLAKPRCATSDYAKLMQDSLAFLDDTISASLRENEILTEIGLPHLCSCSMQQELEQHCLRQLVAPAHRNQLTDDQPSSLKHTKSTENDKISFPAPPMGQPLQQEPCACHGARHTSPSLPCLTYLTVVSCYTIDAS